jgi:hypothetical protein
MADFPDKEPSRTELETGEISQRQDQTGKTPGLSYNDDFATNDRLGARIDKDTQPAEQEQALRNTIPKTIGNKRDDQLQELPKDPIDLGTKGPKNPNEPSDQDGLNHKNF